MRTGKCVMEADQDETDKVSLEMKCDSVSLG